MKNLVFVYGTLMRGRGNHGFLHGARFLGAGRVEGLALYDVTPYYPGAVREEGGAVLGEVYEVDEEMLADLDRLEGNGILYRRERFPVALETGETVEAWVYLWLRGVHPKTRVPLQRQPWRKKKAG
jgi:gamma-glutamylcyclotransferase (GGCT)/AIG2-like uncharacterized protein YtfP